MRRSDRIRRKKKVAKNIVPVKKTQQKQEHKPKSAKRGGWYDVHYKKLLLIPFILLLAGIISIGIQVATTGDFIHRGVSLKGGLLITAPSTDVNPDDFGQSLRQKFPSNDITVRSLQDRGSQVAITVSADVNTANQEEITSFITTVRDDLGVKTADLSIETIGSSLGATFFAQTIKALFIAFVFMGFVVFLYFGSSTKLKVYAGIASAVAAFFMYSALSALNIIAIVVGLALLIMYARYSVPSIAVILAAFSDIVLTLAIVNLLGIKMSTAGIAAFLMLIGYSVDTDILLSTRVLKRKVGSVYDRIIGAVKTGLTMNATTGVAVLLALVFAQSEVLSQIMLILLIGLVVDMVNTWFQNVGILRWYLEKTGDNT